MSQQLDDEIMKNLTPGGLEVWKDLRRFFDDKTKADFPFLVSTYINVVDQYRRLQIELGAAPFLIGGRRNRLYIVEKAISQQMFQLMRQLGILPRQRQAKPQLSPTPMPQDAPQSQ